MRWKKLEDCVEVVGGGEGENEGALDTAAAEEAVPNVVAEPWSYTNQEVIDDSGSSARGSGARAPHGFSNAAAAWWASAQHQGASP